MKNCFAKLILSLILALFCNPFFNVNILPDLQAAAPAKPNVIFILTDDQNNDTIGCFGGKVLTPNMDRLVAEGVKLTRAHSVSSVCTPSRYICLTGQYPGRCTSERFLKVCPPNEPSNVGFNVQVAGSTPNVARVLKANGYATGFVGKWHTGGPQLLPYKPDVDIKDPKVISLLVENQKRLCDYIKETGFDYAASVYRGNLADHKLDALVAHNMEWVTKGALDFLDQYKDRPFYLHVCPTLQHGPPPAKSIPADPRLTPIGFLPEPLKVQAPRESIAPRLKAAGIAENMGHATWLDDAIGALVKKLEDLKLLDNTVFLLFSDNATMGGKGTCYEGGVRTPAFIRWKGQLPASAVCDKLIGNIDFVPTILEICGAKAPANMKIDGESFMALLAGKSAAWREALFLEIGHTRGIATEQWKYIAVRYPAKMQEQIKNNTLGRAPYHMDTSLDLQKTAESKHPAYWDADQLYDLKKDPTEQKNLAKEAAQAKTLAEMKEKLKKSLAQFPRPFGEFHSGAAK